MSTCWKCSRELPEGMTECPDECRGEVKVSPEFMKLLKQIFTDSRPIDWAKVKTAEDLKTVVHAIFAHHRFDPKHYPELERFLKE